MFFHFQCTYVCIYMTNPPVLHETCQGVNTNVYFWAYIVLFWFKHGINLYLISFCFCLNLFVEGFCRTSDVVLVSSPINCVCFLAGRKLYQQKWNLLTIFTKRRRLSTWRLFSYLIQSNSIKSINKFLRNFGGRSSQ